MFIDRLLEATDSDKLPPELRLTGPCISALKSAVVFDVDNIAHYYWQNKKNNWDMTEDFPNVAPVYPNMWMEWTIPQGTEVQVEGKPRLVQYTITWGNHLTSYEFTSPEEINWASKLMGWRMDKIINPCDNIKWFLRSAAFIENKVDKLPIMTHEMFLCVRADGHIWIPQGTNGKYLYAIKYTENKAGVLMQKYHQDGQIGIGEIINVPSLALSFMHCKNVSVKTVEHAAKLQKARQSRGKRPLVDYHLLEIQPVVKILKEQGQSEVSGLQRALHLCRGHFKDFTEKGLFGKYHGLYWWDAQVRGKASDSMMLKDYKVLPSD